MRQTCLTCGNLQNWDSLMDLTPRLALPYLLPNQAQKHVTLNEAISRLDTIVQMVAQSATQDTPPPSPANGDIHILPDVPLSGDWSTSAGPALAIFRDGVWEFISPKAGWSCFVLDAQMSLRFNGTEWSAEYAGGSSTILGVNTTADETNRLAVKADAELLSHDDVTPGSGDARKIINKSDTPQTASILFQSDWEGRAEIGLVGNDMLSFKVSADGETFQESARFDTVSGKASFPLGIEHSATGLPVSQILPTPGGDGVVSVFRLDGDRAVNPRSFVLSGIAGDTLTLTSPHADTVFDVARMTGVSMVRIWNLSRSPIAPAWVVAAPDAYQLEVRDPGELAGWTPGDTIQLGDPVTETPGRVIALDISPMMLALFGTTFHQNGILLKVRSLPSASGACGLDVSGDGSSGSFLGVLTLDDTPSSTGQFIVPSTVSSPVSSTNLLFIREIDLGYGAGVSIVSVNALLV